MPGVMLVTGGGRGIGAGIAKLGAERGYSVAITYRSNAMAAEAVTKELRSVGANAVAIRADMRDETAVRNAFETVDEKLGPLTALVNSAAISGTKGTLAMLQAVEMMEMLATNVYGPLLACQHASKRMARSHGGNGGGIVNISSVAAREGGAGRNVHYAASKGAINSMTIGLARELASEGIRVNAVVPGTIATASQELRRLSQILPSIPMGRAGEVAEVAQVVLWLLSDDASYVTGALVDVGGGR